MGLPKQIQAALDAADATLAEANGPPPPLPEQLPTQTAVDPFVQPGNPEPPVSAEPPPPAPAPSTTEETYAAKYRSLQGIFNKEVPALQQQVKSLQSDLSEAVERLNRASEQKEQKPKQEPEVSSKDIENFGGDLVDMISRVSGASIGRATQVFDSRMAAVETQLTQLAQTLQGATQQVAMTAEQSFFDRVTKAVPNWQDVNADPDFLAWLAETDPVYGVTRQAALQNAQERLDADRAAAVFQAYLGPKQVAPKAPDPLDKQMSPKGAATVAPTPTEKTVLTQAQITAFYDDVRRGMYRGREQEFARIELIINTALSEGRVQ